jgi:hypothetical protein
MNALKLYANHLKQSKVHDAILSDLRSKVLRELKRMPNGKAVVDGVEFYCTTKVTRHYSKDVRDMLDDLQATCETLKERAEISGKVKLEKRPSFDAAIPKSAEKRLLKPLRDFQKYFGKK